MSAERPKGKADVHVHTDLSDGMASPQQVLDYVESQTDLDVIAITDHDDLLGSLATREAWARSSYRFEVVTGVEVTAIEGHVLALFVETPLPYLRPLEEVLAAIHRQGGLAIAAHPMSWLTRSLNERSLDRIAASRRDGVYLDGLETANQSPGARAGLSKAAELNRQRYHLAEVGGGDAHFLKTIGSAYTEFPGTTAEDLRRSILEHTTRSVNGYRPGIRELGPLQIARQSLRGLTATPRAMGWRATANSFIKRIFTVR